MFEEFQHIAHRTTHLKGWNYSLDIGHENLRMRIFYIHLLHSRLFSEMRVCRGLVTGCDESEVVALDKHPAMRGLNSLNTMCITRYNSIIWDNIMESFWKLRNYRWSLHKFWILCPCTQQSIKMYWNKYMTVTTEWKWDSGRSLKRWIGQL
jgi:hypothetical protein